VSEIDLVRLHFNPAALALLNVVLGLVMFGVAMDLRLGDFAAVLRRPLPVVVGLTAQFLLLPALTFLLAGALRPAPSIALGMMLVAACPGGNISNFLTHHARGTTAVSVTMTAIATAAAIVMTPFNLAFWAGRNPDTRAILADVALDPVEMVTAVLLLLGVPLLAGLYAAHRHPAWVARMRRPMRTFSLAAFGLFVVAALAANWAHFRSWVPVVAMAVLLQNGMALATGYLGATVARLPEADRRAVAIEVGIQNSGLGLILVLNFFGGLGGMAVVAAWWGVWHMVSGLALASLWARRPPRPG